MDEAHDRAGGTDPELGAALRRELAELPESHRLPLLLHCCGGLDYQRIAEQVGCSPGNARVRVHRALERLRQRLQRAGFATGAAAIAGQLHAADASSLVSPTLIAKCHALLASGQAPVLSSSAVFGGSSLAAKLALAAAIGGGALAIPLAYALTRAPAPPPRADVQLDEVPASRQEAPRPAAAPAAPQPVPPALVNHRYRGVVVRIDREEHRVAVKQGDRFEAFAWRRHADGGGALAPEEVELARRVEALAVGSEVEIVWEAAKVPSAPPPPEPAADGQHRKHHEPHRLIVALEVFGPADGAVKTDPF
jgi:hypothetical protein